MLNDLLKANKEQQQADQENPLNLLAVNDFLKPAAGYDNMFKNKQNAFRMKLGAVANTMNANVFSKMKERMSDEGSINKELASIVGESTHKELSVLEKSLDSTSKSKVNMDDLIENGAFSLDDFKMEGGACNIDEVPCWHDIKKDYESMENFLGVLDEGCAFGEYAMQNDGREKCPEKRVRAFSAIAMQSTLVISFSRTEWDKIIKARNRFITDNKKNYLCTTEQFQGK